MCACNTISIFAITNAECSQSRMLIESIASNWISPLANRYHLSESLKPDNMHWKFPERSRERIPLICWRLKLARISFVVNNKCYWNLHWAFVFIVKWHANVRMTWHSPKGFERGARSKGQVSGKCFQANCGFYALYFSKWSSTSFNGSHWQLES